ncbi:MAG: hypothetical protein GF331_23775 [Chitinivibrionales bacterium]|nr:hypothetical protein [Chitinivibrionales bacterium]
MQSASRKDAETIRLVLTREIAGAGTLRCLHGKAPDVSGCVTDNTPPIAFRWSQPFTRFA